MERCETPDCHRGTKCAFDDDRAVAAAIKKEQ
jgi:hypothetical protein